MFWKIKGKKMLLKKNNIVMHIKGLVDVILSDPSYEEWHPIIK